MVVLLVIRAGWACASAFGWGALEDYKALFMREEFVSHVYIKLEMTLYIYIYFFYILKKISAIREKEEESWKTVGADRIKNGYRYTTRSNKSPR